MKPVKTIGVKIITHTISSPALSTPRIGGVAFGGGPANTKVGGLTGHIVVYLIDDQLKVPFLILCRTLTYAQEDVGSYTVKKHRDQVGVYF